MTDLADRITLYRARHDLTKKDFGKLVGVSSSTVCKWESGRNKPSYDNLRRIEDLLYSDQVTHTDILWCDDLDQQVGMILPAPSVLERDEPARDWRRWAVIFSAAVVLAVLLTFTMKDLA